VRQLTREQLRDVLANEVLETDVGDTKSFSSDIVGYYSSPPFVTAILNFISEYAKQLALGRAYKVLTDDPAFRETDSLFEAAAIGLLLREKKLIAWRLRGPPSGGQAGVVLSLNHRKLLPTLTLSQEDFVRRVRTLMTVSEIDDEPSPLIVPLVRNQPGVDAAGARDRLYQATRAARHPIKFGAIEPFYKNPNGTLRKIQLVFIIHPHYKSTFTKQPIIECTQAQREEADEYVEQLATTLFEPVETALSIGAKEEQ
jgi:hypothetical protein